MLAVPRRLVRFEIVIQIVDGDFVLKMVADLPFAYLVVKHSSLVLVGHSRLNIRRYFSHSFLDVRQISFGAQCILGSLFEMLKVFLLAPQYMTNTLKGKFDDLRDIAPFSMCLK